VAGSWEWDVVEVVGDGEWARDVNAVDVVSPLYDNSADKTDLRKNSPDMVIDSEVRRLTDANR
jgi:hypothetical protein